MKFMKVVQVCLRCVLSAVSWIVTPIINKIFSFLYDDKVTVVPPVEDEILLQSALSLARKIRTRELKAVSVMECFITRVILCHDQLNTVIARRFDEALEEARALDEELDQDPGNERFSRQNMPFLGVPLSVKEAFAVKGMPNSAGLVARRDLRSEQDCLVVRRLKQAGAIPFCITNVSELCMWYESANRLYGRTNNPYNTTRIVGGSSGGEGCNIGSGGAVIGIGSDIGGSIRMPAFFNGIYGHRPSRGLVPNEGQFPSATGTEEALLSTGPMCRYAEDILPQLKIMAATNKQADLDKQVDVSKLCIYNVVDDGGSLLVANVDPQLKQAQAELVDYLANTIGAKVEKISIPKLQYSVEMWATKMTTSGGKKFCEFMAMSTGKDSINPYTEFLKWLVGLSKHTLPAIALGMTEKLDHLMESGHQKAFDGFDKLEKEIAELLDEDCVIIYPSHPKIAPYHNEPLLYPFNWAYTGIFNTLGLPVTQVPLGLSREGLPMGVQIVGGMNNDRVTIAVAEKLEQEGVAGWANPGVTKL